MSKHEIPLSDGQLAGLVLMVYKVAIPEGSSIAISPEHTTYEWVDRTTTAERLAAKYPTEFTSSL